MYNYTIMDTEPFSFFNSWGLQSEGHLHPGAKYQQDT